MKHHYPLLAGIKEFAYGGTKHFLNPFLCDCFKIVFLYFFRKSYITSFLIIIFFFFFFNDNENILLMNDGYQLRFFNLKVFVLYLFKLAFFWGGSSHPSGSSLSWPFSWNFGAIRLSTSLSVQSKSISFYRDSLLVCFGDNID